jgi:hypothetical protein
VVQQPGIGQEDEDEQRRRGDQLNQHGQRDQGTQQARKAGGFAQADREQQREEQAGNDGPGSVDQVIEDRPREMRVGE